MLEVCVQASISVAGYCWHNIQTAHIESDAAGWHHTPLQASVLVTECGKSQGWFVFVPSHRIDIPSAPA